MADIAKMSTSSSEMTKIQVRTLDTNVITILSSYMVQFRVLFLDVELWVDFGNGTYSKVRLFSKFLRHNPVLIGEIFP